MMEFRIEKAAENLYVDVVSLIRSVWKQIEEKDWFTMEEPEEILKSLKEGRGTAFAAIEAETGCLAGVFLTAYPGLSDGNLGRDIGMEEAELEFVAHMDYAAVLPKYRGYGLQYRLMQVAEAELRAAGYRYLMCTVHPDNLYSMGNVLKQGYEVIATKEKYGGLMRNILIKSGNLK